MKRKIFIVLVVLLVLIQFIRPARNNGLAATPKDVTHYVQVPDTVMHILQRSCYDCHSNHTVYPWYVEVNPVGLWLNNHIQDGKRAINFSDLTSLDKRKLDHRFKDIAEEVESGDMPLSSYTLIHTYAKLNKDEIKTLKDWTAKARMEIDTSKYP